MSWTKALTGSLATFCAAACQQSFDYDAASDSERKEWLESVTRDAYFGLKGALPEVRSGIYMKMGRTSIDVDRRVIDITINSDIHPDVEAFDHRMTSAELRKRGCPRAYIGTKFERNDVKIVGRYTYKNGSYFMAAELSRKTCARYAKS